MKYAITGKRGSFAELITSYIKDTENLDVDFMLPGAINKASEKIKVIYICIPFKAAWDYIVTDPYNIDLTCLFVDEVMEFRNLNRWDFIVDFDGSVDYKSIAYKIAEWIKKDRHQIE